jgi:hypothetical protein
MAKLWLTLRAKTEIEEKTFQSENDPAKKHNQTIYHHSLPQTNCDVDVAVVGDDESSASVVVVEAVVPRF